MRPPPFLIPLTDLVLNMSEFTMSPWTIAASAISSYRADHESPRDRLSCCAERTGCWYWAATRRSLLAWPNHEGALGGRGSVGVGKVRVYLLPVKPRSARANSNALKSRQRDKGTVTQPFFALIHAEPMHQWRRQHCCRLASTLHPDLEIQRVEVWA